MKVIQISVFLENRAGRLAEVTKLLGKVGINIRALSLADTSDFGILRLIVNDPDKAFSVLKGNGFTVGKTEVVAIEVPDRPGGLAQILEILAKKAINVEYMYAFVQRNGQNAVILFRIEKLDEAIELLSKNGVSVLPGEEVYNI
jgi:hypothetical protein